MAVESTAELTERQGQSPKIGTEEHARGNSSATAALSWAPDSGMSRASTSRARIDCTKPRCTGLSTVRSTDAMNRGGAGDASSAAVVWLVVSGMMKGTGAKVGSGKR